MKVPHMCASGIHKNFCMQKYGDLFEIETLGVPWIHHSQLIKIEHSKYNGMSFVEKTIIKSDADGRVRMYIYFRGGEINV